MLVKGALRYSTLSWKHQSILRGWSQATHDPNCHYSDIVMSVVTSQITGVSNVYSTVCSDVDQRKHQSSASLAFVGGNSPVTGEFPAQRDSNAENVFIWWRHHGLMFSKRLPHDASIQALLQPVENRRAKAYVTMWQINTTDVMLTSHCHILRVRSFRGKYTDSRGKYDFECGHAV